MSNRKRANRNKRAYRDNAVKGLKSWALTFSIIGVSTSALAVAVSYSVPEVVSNVEQGFAKLGAQISSDVVVMSNTHPAAINGATDSINAAIKLATEQEARDAKIIAENETNSKKIMAATYQAGKVQANIAKNLIDYGSTGQGHNPCQVISENSVMDDAFRIAEAKAKVKINETDNAPGRLMPSRAAAIKHRQDIHKKFCTQEEVAQGMECSGTSSLPAADQNAAILTMTKAPDSLAAEASRAYRQNILGKPDVALPSGTGQTAAGQAYLMATNRKSALYSFPAMSLAHIEAMAELNPDLKDKEGNPMSANDALLETVGRYYGGKDSKEWQESMIKAQPRGLLAEMARMEGLSLWMQFNKYKSNQRVMGNLAALNISSAIPLEQDMDLQREIIMNNTVISSIGNEE